MIRLFKQLLKIPIVVITNIRSDLIEKMMMKKINYETFQKDKKLLISL